MGFYIEIDRELCKGCQICMPECPENVIGLGDEFNTRGWRFALALRNCDCIGCKKCAVVCPDAAIEVWKEA